MNPHGLAACGFSYRLRLSPPSSSRHRRKVGFAVWTIPSPCPGGREFRCCPSSLYTFPAEFSAGLGSGSPLQGSPNLGSSTSPVSRRALKFRLSPLRLPISPRPRGRSSSMIDDDARIYTSDSECGRAAALRLACFCAFLGFARMMLIAAASRLVLMCAA